MNRKTEHKRLQELWDAADKMVKDYGKVDPQTGQRTGAIMAGPILADPLEIQGLVEQIWFLEGMLNETGGGKGG